MQCKNEHIEYKSLAKVFGKKADLKSLATTCVAFANAQGGYIYIGIDDKNKEPPTGQVITQEIVNKVLSGLRALTDSVALADPVFEDHLNGSNYFHFQVLPTSRTIATTSSGRIFIRIQDTTCPVSGDEVTRLAAEKNAFQWELVECKTFQITQSYLYVFLFLNKKSKKERGACKTTVRGNFSAF